MKHSQLKAGALIAALLFFAQCNTQTSSDTQKAISKKDTVKKEKEEDKTPEPVGITYHAMPLKDSGMAEYKRFTAEQKAVIYALNRKDASAISKRDTLVVPDSFVTDIMVYSPFPADAPFLNEVHKIVFFSYPIQAFAAYENGKLVRWGPTSMGKKSTLTPTGLFFANWKAKETHSTVKDEWILKWNFNIMNRFGVGWHQYAMPGYPASHSCLRLLEVDARYLYDWADQWKLKDNETLLANGTPAIVYGAYPFGSPRPWKALWNDPKANTVTLEMLQKEVENFLPKIMEEQQKRDGLTTVVTDTTGTDK